MSSTVLLAILAMGASCVVDRTMGADSGETGSFLAQTERTGMGR
jgi:hypothetical protein